MNEPLESMPPPPALPPRTNPARVRSPRLAWAITLGESALLAGTAIPLFKYWMMFPAPIRLGGATVLAVLALLVSFRIARFHLRWWRHRNKTRRMITRPSKNEPEPAPVLTAPHAAKAVPAELPCKKRLQNAC